MEPSIYKAPGPFVLETGHTLPELRIAYHTYGQPNAAHDNVVWVCHALTANSDVADWWPHTVEAGCFLDPARHFVVCANILGSHYGTTGPLHVNPETGSPYYKDFPPFTIRDIVRAHRLLAGALGIGRIDTLHCTTPALLCRLYGEEMRRRGEGYILVMSSATAWMPYPTIAAYAATKSFLRTFARSLNFEFRKYGVRVTGVFPGAVDTPLYDLDAACRRRLLRWGVMSAPQGVAQHGLRALFRGRSSCIPGVFTKICVCVCRLVPAWLMRCVLRIPAVARLF